MPFDGGMHLRFLLCLKIFERLRSNISYQNITTYPEDYLEVFRIQVPINIHMRVRFADQFTPATIRRISLFKYGSPYHTPLFSF